MNGRSVGVIVTWVGFLFLSGLLAAQPAIGTWTSYTSKHSVRSLAQSSGTSILLAATEGGIFQFSPSGGVLASVTNTDGILSNNTTAVGVDGMGGTWVGSANGSISHLPFGSSAWLGITGIKNSSYTNKLISQFYSYGDTVFVVSQFGVSVYRISRDEFGDTYASFPFVSNPTVSSVALMGNRIWVGTSLGVASAPLTSSNLSAPNVWSVYTSANGLPSPVVTALAVFHDTLVAATQNGLAFFSGGGFQSIAAFAGRSIVALESGAELSLLYNAGGITVESLPSVIAPSNVTAQLSGVTGTSFTVRTVNATTQTFVGTTFSGVMRWDGVAWSSIIPNAPASNLFNSLAVDADGVLWCASGKDAIGKGFYRFNRDRADSLQWKNFSFAQYPVMGSDASYKVSIGALGSVWVSSWGSGVTEVRGDTIVRTLNTSTTPHIASDADVTNFPIAGGVQADASGNTWIAMRNASDQNTLLTLNSDGTFQYYQNPFTSFTRYVHPLAIDQNGTKWIGNSEPINTNGSALFYFNESNVVSGTQANGGWGFLSTDNGLPSTIVLSLMVDQDNDLWVGTGLGCLVIVNPRNPLASGSRQSVFALREQFVQAIAVDAVNNKWVGTKEGVFVLNTDGTQLLAQYRTENTNGTLLSNDVRSIAIDQRRGVVYFGTDQGLSSLNIAAVETRRTMTTLDIAPNPFLIPQTSQVTVANLAANSSVKILNSNGTLVQQFKAQGGGRAFWNGRDGLGNLVGSGIYFVVAYAENGNQVATGKVAVVRK